MLQFIFGTAFTNKTEIMIEKIKNIILDDKKVIIIVPEQASFDTERMILKSLGDSFSKNVEVYSFSRLQDEICRKIGGIGFRILKDSDKIIFMSKALRQTAAEMNIWGKYATSMSFAKTILDTIGEFKVNGVSVDEIKNASLIANSKGLKDKLHDIAIIYEAYDLLVAERFLDPVDKLTKLYLNLENYSFFEGKTVFFSGFKGFTGQQYKIIDRVFTQTENVYFSFTHDAGSSNEFDVFANIRKEVDRIERLAKKHNVFIAEPIILENNVNSPKGLLALEGLLAEKKVDSIEQNDVFICEAKTIFDEAEFVARTIRRLVRTENYRFRDFVIIARDSEKYQQAVEYACIKNKIDCFIDKKIPLMSFPLSIAVISAIKALDFSTENILRFHKSGISLLSVEEISRLENYTYLWNIKGKLWLNEWDMDVRGFVTDELDDDSKEKLEEINAIRRKAITPIINFKEKFNSNAYNMSKAIIDLLDECNVSKALLSLCNDFGAESFTTDALKQSYDCFMEVIDSLVTSFANQNLKISEYYDALNLALSLEEIGVIPQTLDEVVFGQADRIRPSFPKIAFILGANQGVFPQFSQNNGIFAIKERKEIIGLGLEIADNEIFTAIDENYLVYCNLCCPSERLYICYSQQTLKGESLTPSTFVSLVESKLSPQKFYEPNVDLNKINIPETTDSAYSELCRKFSKCEDYLSLKNALDGCGYNYKTDVLIGLNDNKKSITEANAKKLYGSNIYMSATKFDTFNRCRFSYFCKYGLRLKKLQPADFDVLQRGTIVHYVLEKIITEYKQKISEFSRQETDALCDKYVNEYLDLVVGYRSVQSARHDFLISKISRSLKEVIYHLSLEFKQSHFVPTHCELKIGFNDGLPLEFPYDHGNIIINGSIDRVDEYNGYIRVVDYKTGTKSFKLPDVLFGLNLQMLIYLYALIRGQNRNDESAAGIFYMPSKRDLNNEGMAMNGLVKADKELIYAMEKENNGEFVPMLSLNKDGSVSKSSASFITSEEFGKIFDYIELLMRKTGNSISGGKIDINPVDGRESSACDYCDFKAVCRIENNTAIKVPTMKNYEVFEAMERGDNDVV